MTRYPMLNQQELLAVIALLAERNGGQIRVSDHDMRRIEAGRLQILYGPDRQEHIFRVQVPPSADPNVVDAEIVDAEIVPTPLELEAGRP